MFEMYKLMRGKSKQKLIVYILIQCMLSTAHAVPVGMDSQSAEFDELLNSKELSQYSRDLFGSVISAVRKGDNQKAKLLIRRVLSAYPEHPVAWEFDGTLKFLDGDYKGAEKSLIKSLTYMPEGSTARAKMGLVFLAQNKQTAAKKLFLETLSQDPDNWIAHRYLARLADSVGDTDKAVEHYQNLIQSRAGKLTAIHEEYARDLARLKRYDEMVELLEPISNTTTDPELTLLLAEAYMSLGKIEAARQQLDKAKKINPDDARLALLSAIDLRISGQPEQSAQALEALIASNHKNALFYYHYGLALMQQDKLEKASHAFENAANNSLDSSSLRVMLASEFETLKQPENVIKTLEPLAKIQHRKDVIYLLVQAYSDIGQWQKGLMHTDRMIEKYPQFVPARLLHVEILKGMNRMQDAERYAEQLFNQFPNSTAALKSHVKLLFQNNNKQQALDKLQKMVDKKPDHKMLVFMLANQYQFANLPLKAEAIYRKLLKDTPNNPGLLNNLAIVLSQQTGKLKEALVVSKKAVKQAPNNAAIADSLGWIFHLSRQYKQAEKTLQQALKLQPNMAEAQCHLGLVKLQRNQRDALMLEACMQSGLDNSLQQRAKQALGK